MTKKILHDFHDIRNASLDTGGRDDIPRPRRARGRKIEMRSAGGADVDRDQPRRSRRATAGRSREKSTTIAGEAVKHRADKKPRRPRFADGGSTSGMPYGSGMMLIPIPQTQIAPGRFTAPAVPNQPDYTGQMINAIGTWGRGDSKDGNQGVTGGIKLPGGGTLGDATQDFFQDLGDWRGGAVRKRGGHVRAGRPQDVSQKRGGRVQQHHQRKGQTA
jgi:hypothetical protein